MAVISPPKPTSFHDRHDDGMNSSHVIDTSWDANDRNNVSFDGLIGENRVFVAPRVHALLLASQIVWLTLARKGSFNEVELHNMRFVRSGLVTAELLIVDLRTAYMLQKLSATRANLVLGEAFWPADQRITLDGPKTNRAFSISEVHHEMDVAISENNFVF